MKKMMALLMAVVMTLAMCTTAFAADPVTHNVSTTSTTHTYQIYQVFTGSYDAASGQLQNLKYGQNAKTGTAGESVSATDMAALDAIANTEYANDQAKITALSPYVDLTTAPIAEIGKGKNAIAALPEGYYVIKDTDDSLSDPETYTLYLFKVLGDDLTIAPKDGTTEVDKTVGETNDTTGAATTGNKGADYDEGDSIPYTLTITLPKNVTDYKTYAATLTDTLSQGLTPPAQADVTVTIKDKNGNAITGTGIAGYTAPAATVSGQVITVSFSAGNGTDAIGEAGAALNEAVITVTYNAVVNDKAVSGAAGNANTYKVEYSNNPNGPDTGETPEKTVKVYTYELDIEKVDGNGEPLQGADFTLYKEVAPINQAEIDAATAAGTQVPDPEYPTGAKTGAAIKEELAAQSSKIDASKLADNKYYVAVGMTEAVTKEGDTVTAVNHHTDIKIDAGSYVLIETTVPAGYNAYEGMEITITSTIDANGNLTGLTATPSTLTVGSDKDVVSGEVENNSGSELPETGGIGTTIFYILGSILVIGAGVILVARRMNVK